VGRVNPGNWFIEIELDAPQLPDGVGGVPHQDEVRYCVEGPSRTGPVTGCNALFANS
jgi:hypothetical protein